MYEKITLLNKEEHKDFRFKPVSDLNFAKDMMVVPITYEEVALLCCEYPIVILGGEAPKFAIVVGVEEEQGNVVIDENGKWRGSYVPAFLRRYPFALVRTGDEALAIGVDLHSGCFSDPEGEPLFDQEGNPQPVLEQQIAFLETFERQMTLTSEILKAFNEKKVLSERVLTYKKDGEEKKVGGFFAFDRTKLAELDDAVLADWARRGWIDLVVCQNHSMKQFQKVVALANADSGQ